VGSGEGVPGGPGDAALSGVDRLKKAPTNLPASVRQRLLNLANESKQDFGMLLTRFALERFLYRLSVSRHRDAFVLKGALLLQLWTSEVYRPTRDLDLLGQAEGSAKGYRKIFADVCSEKVEDDGVTFLVDTIGVEKIRDEEEYQGVRVSLEARLANAHIPLQIDVGFGDVITPAPLEVEYPSLLAFPRAKLRAYSKESVVAEKFEAIVKLGMANSRMKDFYDLWVMAKRFEFSGSVLSTSLEATFATRGTPLPSAPPLAFTSEFSESPSKQTQWRAFLRKSGLEAAESLDEVVKMLKEFLMPVVEGILSQRNVVSFWRPRGPWKDSH
jgi:predicted nucleotidyltransferase component of viral defense system